VDRLVRAGWQRVREFRWEKAAAATWKVYQLLF
jgi:hypothetical protein